MLRGNDADPWEPEERSGVQPQRRRRCFRRGRATATYVERSHAGCLQQREDDRQAGTSSAPHTRPSGRNGETGSVAIHESNVPSEGGACLRHARNVSAACTAAPPGSTPSSDPATATLPIATVAVCRAGGMVSIGGGTGNDGDRLPCIVSVWLSSQAVTVFDTVRVGVPSRVRESLSLVWLNVRLTVADSEELMDCVGDGVGGRVVAGVAVLVIGGMDSLIDSESVGTTEIEWEGSSLLTVVLFVRSRDGDCDKSSVFVSLSECVSAILAEVLLVYMVQHLG